MITIRNELYEAGYNILEALSIDPELPAEWATVDRCLDWLRERATSSIHSMPLTINVPPGGAVTVWRSQGSAKRPHYGSTLHRALIATCQAVQEAS